MLYKVSHCARHVSANTRPIHRPMHRRVWDCIYTIRISECIYMHVYMEVTSPRLEDRTLQQVCSTVSVTVRDVYLGLSTWRCCRVTYVSKHSSPSPHSNDEAEETFTQAEWHEYRHHSLPTAASPMSNIGIF